MKEIAEFILAGHPDKLCDRIADKIVDFACQRDPLSLVGVEVALHRYLLVVTGCVTTFPIATEDDIMALIFEVFEEAGYGDIWEPHPKDLNIVFDLRLEELDDDLRNLRLISDDQAICIGYAINEPQNNYLPLAHHLAYIAGQHMTKLREQYETGPDGKVIVTTENDSIEKISFSFHHTSETSLTHLYKKAHHIAKELGIKDLSKVVVNGGGDFDVGGPFGDNGLSGKKLVVDAYGPSIPIGGGAWSGKDPHKIDRVGGLIARKLALRAVRSGFGHEAQIVLGYHPGDRQPSIQHLFIDGEQKPFEWLGSYDLSTEAIHRNLRLDQICFADYANGSWFHKPAPWNGMHTQFQQLQIC